MNVSFLVYDLAGTTGWGRYSSEVIRGLVHHGINATVLVATTGDVSGTDLAHRKILSPPGQGPRRLLGLLKDAVRFRATLARADVVHVLAEPYAALPILLGMGKKTVITAYGTYALSARPESVRGRATVRAFQRAARVVAISNFTAGELRLRLGLKNVDVVYSGVRFSHFAKANRGSRDRSTSILSVGAVKPRKGYHISLRAFASLSRKFPNLSYTIVGGNHSHTYRQSLEKCVTTEGIQDRVIFRETLSEEALLEEYGRARIFVLSPVNVGTAVEGFGLVYLEANAAGLPVVGTLGCGAEEAIAHGESGLLVPQEDVAATAEAIERLLTDSDLYSRLASGGARRAEEFSWERTVEQVLEVYQAV